MKPSELLDKATNIDHDMVGVFLGAEVWAAPNRWGQWVAYLVQYTPRGDIASVRVLRIKKGKRAGQPVKTLASWEGVGFLADQIESLNKRKLI